MSGVSDLNEMDKSEIIARYESRLAEYGHDVRTLASGSDEKQEIRYRTLSEIGIKDSQSVLDLGCGFGGFYGFLNDLGLKIEYTGCDIVPGLLKIASSLYPDTKFELRDIQEDGPGQLFDWIVSSQAFNNRLRYESNTDVIKDVISKAFEYCRRGIAIDMMSKHVEYEEERLFYFNPSEMFSFAKTISPRVVLRHDYLKYEFCIYIFRSD